VDQQLRMCVLVVHVKVLLGGEGYSAHMAWIEVVEVGVLAGSCSAACCVRRVGCVGCVG